MATTFQGDPSLRESALADLASGANPAWFPKGATEAESRTCAQRFGLPESLFLLLARLGDTADEGGRFQAQLLAGAPTESTVRAWLLWIYESSTSGAKAALASTAAAKPAAAIIDLQCRPLTEPVSPATWRAARRALADIKDLPPLAADCADIVAAMAWDLASSPGAVIDTLTAWEIRAGNEYDRSIGWTPEVALALQEGFQKISAQMEAELGVTLSPDLPRDVLDAFGAGMERLWAESDKADLWRLMLERNENYGKVLAEVRQTARNGLLRATMNATATV